MALTSDLLKQNELLSTLTEEQIRAIETLSANNENEVIGSKVREIHDRYDADLVEALGENYKKPAGVHSYEHLKKSVYPLAKQATEYQSKISEYEQTVESLKKQVAEKSTDEGLKQQLKDAETRYEQLKNQYDQDKNSFTEKLTEKEKAFLNVQINNEFDKALNGLKFKEGIPESARNILIESAKNRLTNTYKPDFIDDGKGSKKLVFRNENGDILNNPENQLNPFSSKELLTKELKEVIDFGQKQAGTGTNSQQSGNSQSLDFTGVKSKVDVDNRITKHLMQMGISKTSRDFADKQMELRKEVQNFDSLPMNA